jgi:5-oxoprolinase (ATP-hydrolysing) subunit C
MIEIFSDSALATVQDLGRFGAMRWGVGTAGAMDRMALACGNLLLGNEEGAAAIEVQVFPFEVRFEADLAFALTGADCAATLDRAPLLPWSATVTRAGQVLRLGPPVAARWRGARAYLCVRGGIDVPLVLGSRSTQLRGAFGGLEGRTLRQGDRLAVARPVAGATKPVGIGVMPPALAMPLHRDGTPALRVLPAAEYPCFTPDSRRAFWSESWKITPQSNRYGFRLAGPALEPSAPLELRSHGIVPGVIQVPHGGQPIVQMCDAQPSGGYPKIGTVIEADLWRLGQAPIGSSVRFVETTWDEALTARDEAAGWLADLRRLLELYRERRAERDGLTA